MRRMRFLGWVVLGAVAAGCGGISLFSGRINGAFFEPTGTVFAFVDQLSPAPQLATNPSSRFIASGVYAYFDAAQDQASQNGTNLAELKQEIANHDWISLEWANSNELEVGKTFKTTLIRTTEEPFFRVVDPSATDVTAGFTARVGFRRAPVRHAQGLVGVLFHQQDGHAVVAVELLDDLEDPPDVDRRQPERGLVEQQQLRS